MSITAACRGDSDNIEGDRLAARPSALTEQGGYTKALRNHENHSKYEALL